MADAKRIHGAGGGGGGGGNQVVQQTTVVQAPVIRPTYTADDPGLKSTSFAQMQFLLCEGDIEGPVGGNTIEGLERSVFLDDTPIRVGNADPTPQPSDLVFSWGRPSPNQTGVPGFNRVSTTIGVDTEVRQNLPVAQTVTVADANATWYGRVLLTFEALVMGRNGGDEPGTFATSVAVRVEYEDNGGTVRQVFDGEVSGKFSGPFQQEYEFPFEGEAPWTVRVIRNTADDQDRNADGTDFRSTFNFSTVVLSLDQRLIYPQSSMLSLGIRADQYNQLPQVSVDLRGLRIEVPSNYNPETRNYDGLWDGTFQVAYSNNPAWVLRDLITHDRYGLGQYINADQVDRWTLYRIARYCDGVDEDGNFVGVPGPNGENEPRFTCNVVLQTSEQAWIVLQQLSSIFRGLLYYASGTIVAVQDRPKEAVFTFSPSNTIEDVSDDGVVSAGNFVYSGSAQRARHTAVLASWDDPNDNYQPRVEYIADEEGIDRLGYRAMDLRLMGVTSRGQALRAANWALISESLLTDTVTFSSNEIGAAVRPGDLIKIADPTKAARRYGGRIRAVDGDTITLDDAPTEPDDGWDGTTFTYMVSNDEGEPVLQEREVDSINGATVVLVADADADAPVATFPWLIESPDRTAQLFRVLSVEEQPDGIYAFTALRYREDIYDNVDFNTPLNENEDYLFRPVDPEPPTITTAQVIWDNSQAKMDLAWEPPDTNMVLNGFDLTIREYRLQYQAGSLDDDGNIEWDEVWREVERQRDNREQIPINQFVATDRFRVRLASVSRVGVESDWTEPVTLDDLTVWFPMPDLGGDNGADPPVQNATLTHLNQSSGSQLFTHSFNVPLPPYVNAVRLEGRPDRELTEVEERGLNPPDADGWYFIADIPLGDYYALAFHALTDWTVRISLRTLIPGLAGTTFRTDTVDELELVPPNPLDFRMVYEGGAQSRVGQKRFSWRMPQGDEVPFVDNWPLRRVTDIAVFNVRYIRGFTPTWDRGVPLFSDGIPGDQLWFETNLFDYGEWTVMIRSQDRTGWLSDDQASISIDIESPRWTNVVERIDYRDLSFPGDLVNFTREGTLDSVFYTPPLDESLYLDPLDDAFYEGITGVSLRQDDPAEESTYTLTFEVTQGEPQLVIYTAADATFRWFIRRDPNDGELMYPNPQDALIYGEDDGGLRMTRAFPRGRELVTNDDANVLLNQGDLVEAVSDTTITRQLRNHLDELFYGNPTTDNNLGWHPYAPNEVVQDGFYQAQLVMTSVDGTTAGQVFDIDFVLDYPDVNYYVNDFEVPVNGARVTFPTNTFRAIKAVNLTVQDDSTAAGTALTGIVLVKNREFVDVRTFDGDGNPVQGVVDVFAVGY